MLYSLYFRTTTNAVPLGLTDQCMHYYLLEPTKKPYALIASIFDDDDECSDDVAKSKTR